MMEANKINEVDTLICHTKKSMATGVTESYACLGWILNEETENSVYEDIVDLTFVRPHKIKGN